MSRAARIIIPGCPHHVTQRGNNRQDVFFVDDDRRFYLGLIRDAAERFGLRVEGYCLMTDHLHLLATPTEADSLVQVMKRANQRYAQYVNRLHGRSGHLWQDRFFSCALDQEHFWAALVHVERNPVRAKIVRRAWRWPWSSAAAHCGQRDPTGLLAPRRRSQRTEPLAWREALMQPQDEAFVSKLRLWTSRGRPLGSDRFVTKLERALGRPLRPLPRGRPRKKPINT